MAELREQVAADIRGWDATLDHRTGTAGDAATSEWLAGLVREAGAEPELQTFRFDRWVPGDCAVAVNGRRAEGVPLFDGGMTGPSGVEGVLAPMSDGGGGICVAGSGALPASPPMATNASRPAVGHAAIGSPTFGHVVGVGVASGSQHAAPWIDVGTESR